MLEGRGSLVFGSLLYFFVVGVLWSGCNRGGVGDDHRRYFVQVAYCTCEGDWLVLKGGFTFFEGILSEISLTLKIKYLFFR